MTLEQKETKNNILLKPLAVEGRGAAALDSKPAAVGKLSGGRLARAAKLGWLPDEETLLVRRVVDDFLNLAGRHGRGLGRSQQAGGAASATCETETRSSLPFSKFPRMTLFDDQRSAPFKDMRVIVGSTQLPQSRCFCIGVDPNT